MNTSYMQQLFANEQRYKNQIEQLLEKYHVQPVGDGYIDLILPCTKAVEMIKELAELPIAVECMDWWCHCTPESREKLGCPHGMGGPINKYGEGWFSECVHYPFYYVVDHGLDLDSNVIEPSTLARKSSEILCDYIENLLPQEDFFSECLHPGLFLYVPIEWQRQWYLVS